MSVLLLSQNRVVAGAGGGGSATPFFADNFSGGQLNPSGGFEYVFNGGSPQVSSANAVNGGTHSIRFAYGPDAIGADSTCEVRFRLGRNVPDLFVEYWMYVPSNFFMRETTNNKFFALWREVAGQPNWNYASAVYPTQQFTMEYWGLGGPWARATSRVSARMTSTGNFLITDIDTPTNQRGMIGGPDPMLLGAWNRVRLRFKASSAQSVSDGAFEMWVNSTKLHDAQSMPFWNPTSNSGGTWSPPTDIFWNAGYFLGYANTGFTDLTEFFIGDVKFYDQNPGWV